MKTEKSKESYLSIMEAAELAGISRTTFYRLLQDKASGLSDVTFRIPVLNQLRVRRDEFCNWLEGQKQSAK